MIRPKRYATPRPILSAFFAERVGDHDANHKGRTNKSIAQVWTCDASDSLAGTADAHWPSVGCSFDCRTRPASARGQDQAGEGRPVAGQNRPAAAPLRPGQIERRTHDYARHGTITLLAALDTKSGDLIGQTQRQHRSLEFRNFLDTIEQNVPAELGVHLIIDSVARFCTRTLETGHPRLIAQVNDSIAQWRSLDFAFAPNEGIGMGAAGGLEAFNRRS